MPTPVQAWLPPLRRVRRTSASGWTNGGERRRKPWNIPCRYAPALRRGGDQHLPHCAVWRMGSQSDGVADRPSSAHRTPQRLKTRDFSERGNRSDALLRGIGADALRLPAERHLRYYRGVKQALVPFLLMQPFENAIIHGLRGVRKSGIIAVRAAEE